MFNLNKMIAGGLATIVASMVGFGMPQASEARGYGYGGPVHVSGYYRGGTYVAPHFRSAPDGNFYNNWSTRGNVNPYTGMYGTKTYPSQYGGAPMHRGWMSKFKGML